MTVMYWSFVPSGAENKPENETRDGLAPAESVGRLGFAPPTTVGAAIDEDEMKNKHTQATIRLIPTLFRELVSICSAAKLEQL